MALRDYPGSTGGEGWRGSDRRGEDTNFGVSGLDELGGLGDVFAENEPGFYFFVEAGVFEGFDGGATVRGVIGIGDGYFLDRGIEKGLPAGFFGIEFGIGGRPENEFADGVRIGGVRDDEAGLAEFARIVAVGGEEEIEGSAVLNLREEIAAGAEGEIEFDAGLFFVDGGEIGESEFEIGGGGNFESGLLRKGRKGK